MINIVIISNNDFKLKSINELYSISTCRNTIALQDTNFQALTLF